MIRNPAGQYAEDLLEKGIASLGWDAVTADVLKAKTPEDFYALVRKNYPEQNAQQVINAGRQLYKFNREMKIGDTVLTYNSPQRVYHVGKITGEAQFNPEAPARLAISRAVKWQHTVDRDDLTPAAKNSLGATLTVFQPAPIAIDEIKSLTTGKPTQATTAKETEVEIEDPYAKAELTAHELIKDKLMQLGWEDMQELVAGLLRAMGYKTQVSPNGPDRGKDIVASPDGLGLEAPRIFVEVKHRKATPMGAPEVRSFIGARNPQHDRCLYVSTGGFSREARYEAERANVPTTLIDSDELVSLLIENYEATDTTIRSLIPLRKTYWPI